jgi:hypothetical protein
LLPIVFIIITSLAIETIDDNVINRF